MSLCDKIKKNYITLAGHKIVALTDDSKSVWLYARQVTNMLGYANHKQCINDHVHNTNKCQYKDLDLLKSKKINMNNFQKTTMFINEKAFLHLVCTARTTNSVKAAKELKINLLENKTVTKEIDTLAKIMKVFEGETMKPQYVCFQYRIDLYFPEYKLAIECDENGHRDRKPQNEKNRQKRISKKLNCSWIRYNPDDKHFDIFDVIHNIYEIIKEQNHNS